MTGQNVFRGQLREGYLTLDPDDHNSSVEGGLKSGGHSTA
jgi:hypothetical protein